MKKTTRTRAERDAKNHEDSVREFLAAVTTIRETLDGLTEEAEDHFGVDPDHINWAHVGDANRILAALRETLAIARNENH